MQDSRECCENITTAKEHPDQLCELPGYNINSTGSMKAGYDNGAAGALWSRVDFTVFLSLPGNVIHSYYKFRKA